jgi:tetratricopeptide (TPR) repeat protein
MDGTTRRPRALVSAALRRLRGGGVPTGPSVDPELEATARRATDEQRWEDAADAWRALLDAGAANRANPTLRLGHALRRAGDLAQAAAVLDAAVTEFPDHAGLATEHAQLAIAARDWEAAARRWRRVHELTDGVAPVRAYTQLARAEVQLGDLHDASRTLGRGMAAHPDDLELATENARLASIAQDWVEARSRWEALRARTEPTPPAEVLSQLAKALLQLDEVAQAGVVLEDAIERYPDDIDLRSRAARLATAERDWPEVVRRWADVLDRADAEAPGRAYTESARAHQALGDLDAAEAVLALGRQRLPEDREVASRWARTAAASRRWDAALERYDVVVALPGTSDPVVHRDRARAAVELDDLERAEAALLHGLEQHPGDPMLQVERAFVAVRQLAWDEADARWKEATSAPGSPVPPELYVGMARRCAASFDHERADLVIEEALERYPDSRGVHRQRVRNAIGVQRREHAPADWDWSEALGRAQEALAAMRRDGCTPEDVLLLATELADASALDEARAVLREGLADHPDATPLRHELAVFAAARGDGDEAMGMLGPIASRPDAPWSWRSALVRAHLVAGDTEGAAAVAEAAATAGSSRSNVVAELARIAGQRGDLDEAVARWRELVDLEPRSLAARRHLAVTLRRADDEAAARAVVLTARAADLPLESNPGVVAIVGGGPSLREVDLSPLRGRVHTVAINATATVLPWSDVAVTHDASHLAERFRGYPNLVVAGLPLDALRTRGRLPGFELRRRLVTDRLSELADVLHSGGHTSAHTALGYAHLLRPRRSVLFGVDLTEFWGPNDYWHGAMDEHNRRRFDELTGRATWDRWSAYRARKLEDAPAVFASTLPQLEAAGTQVLNASPVSAVTCFPRLAPEEGIARCLEDDLLEGDG